MNAARFATAVSLLIILGACRGETASTTSAGAPVILISIDTLRADHLPMFGYGDVQTPHLDALRRDAILFTNAYAHVPLTLPSHGSVMSGLLPQTHGVRNNIGYRFQSSTPTIATMLRGAGYQSGAAISAYVLRGATGLSHAFDFYEDSIENQAGAPTGTLQRAGNVTSSLAKQWIATHAEKPFFFFLHLFEPHSPYEPPPPFDARYRERPYDGEIAATDAIVGDFLADLKSRGIYDRALIILFADHGEGLSDHGEAEHGIFLYREAIHVPLMVKLPAAARAGETITHPVGLVDILPTVAQVTNTAAPAKIDGVSLLASKANRTIYSETLYPRIHLGWSELRSLENERHHYIEAPRPELYDMAGDPRETKNILSDQRRVYNAMKTELAQYGSAVALPARIDPEEAKKLAALGYLTSTPSASSGPLPDPKDRIGEIAEVSRAASLARDGQYDAAITSFREVLANNPKLSDAWNQLALTLEKRGRFEEASEAYRQAIEHSAELAGEFALSRGGILLRLGRFDEAAKHAELGEKVNPGGAHLLRARVSLARKDLRAAEREAREARNDASSRSAASVLLAQTLSEQGRLAEALTLIDQTSSVESRDTVRGDVLARMERYPEAVDAFRAGIAAYPYDLNAYSKLAIVYVLMGRIEEARAVVAEMVRKNDTDEARRLAARTRKELGL